MADDLDPEELRPGSDYHVARDAAWYYLGDSLAEIIALGPATDGESGDDWVITLSATMSSGL